MAATTESAQLPTTTATTPETIILNRNEKKARKLFNKVPMKLVPGIERVAIKRGRMIFAIANPTVYKTPNGQYVVFGEAKVEDNSFNPQAAAAQSQGQENTEQAQEFATASATSSSQNAPKESQEEEEAVDASGVDEKDISIVMEQANVSRANAIAALKNNDNDIVNTIMELSI